MNDVGAGEHTLTLSASVCDGEEIVLRYSWARIPNFIDISQPIETLSLYDGDGRLLVNVTDKPSSVVLQPVLPLSPSQGEAITMSCVSNAAILITPDAIRVDAGTFADAVQPVFTLSGVLDYSNAGPADVPFTVQCYVTSSSKSSIVSSLPMYVGASMRGVSGYLHRVRWPLFQDVLLLSPVGDGWISSLSDAGLFSLSLSTNTTAMIVGDVTFRGAGPHFSTDTFVTVGGMSINISALHSDVRPILMSLNHSFYSSAAVDWSGPVDAVEIEFPSYNETCLRGDVDICALGDAYRSIQLYNAIDSVRVSCPGLCPGYPGSSNGGAYYTLECEGYLTGPSCLDVVTAGLCAYGIGDGCRPCPRGAFCPGGNRLW